MLIELCLTVTLMSTLHIITIIYSVSVLVLAGSYV